MFKARFMQPIWVTASLCSLSACTPTAPAPSAMPTPLASAPASVRPEPSANLSPIPHSPSIPPSLVPSPQASVMPEPTPKPTLSPEPSDVSEYRPSFRGIVHDDSGAPLDGVTVIAKSLNSHVPYEDTSTTVGGAYAFNGGPSSVQIEITANRQGYTTRRRVEVLRSNAGIRANHFDFGPGGSDHNGTINNALSDLPEVIRVKPGANASGVSPQTSFVLSFSEPMHTPSVENCFAIRAYNDRRLSIDDGRSTGNTVVGNATIATWNGKPEDASLKHALTGTPIWDKNAFDIQWNADQTEVTFSFKTGYGLPSDKDSNLVPDYRVSCASFHTPPEHVMQDLTGAGRSHHHFKLTDGPFQDSYKFAVRTDTTVPTLAELQAETEESGGVYRDAIRVRFSERLFLPTLGLTLAGGMPDNPAAVSQAPAAYPGPLISGSASDPRAVAQNYQVHLVRGSGNIIRYAGSWGALGGQAVYDLQDPSRSTVWLLPPALDSQDVNLGPISAGQTLSGSVHFSDGSTAPFTYTSSATLTQGEALAAELNTQDNISGSDASAGFSATAFVGSGSLEALRLQLNANASYQPASDVLPRSIAWIQFSGGTAGTHPGALNGQALLAGASASQAQMTHSGRLDLYRPGDSVQVTVAGSILDPAGNRINIAKNTLSTVAQ